MPPVISPNIVWLPPRTLVRLQSKPVKGRQYTTEYNRFGHRLSDGRTEYPAATWMRNNYAKQQPFNCDSSYIVLNSSDGFWHLYDTATSAYIKRLNGPVSENAEIQWDKKDPHVLYYGNRDGGTVIHRLDVVANTNSIQYDFTADIHAIWPNASRCDSGSEGSPSADGRLWGFRARSGDFNTCYGLFVMDIFAKTIVWHINAPHGDPNSTTMSPSGRYFVEVNPAGMFAYPLAGGSAKQVHHTQEHADTFALPGGHDGLVTIDYQTNLGDMFWVDLDDPALTRHVFDHAYHNPTYASNYGWHFSGRALRKPGYVVCSNIGAPPCNMYILNTTTGQKLGFAANYAVRNDYHDEAHACPSSTLDRIVHNDNYGQSLNIDAYVTMLPPLP